MPLTADSKITEIKGIGESLATKFNRLNINTVRDLLFHVPIKYQDSSHLLSIEEFLLKGEGTFLAEIVDIKTFRTRSTIYWISRSRKRDFIHFGRNWWQ